MHCSGPSLKSYRWTYSHFARSVTICSLILSISIGESVFATVMTVSSPESSSAAEAFYPALTKALKKRKTSLGRICPVADPTARRFLEEYGAMFVADKGVVPPPVCVFISEEQVLQFQEDTGYDEATIGDTTIELQPAAMKSYLKARDEARKEGLDITP